MTLSWYCLDEEKCEGPPKTQNLTDHKILHEAFSLHEPNVIEKLEVIYFPICWSSDRTQDRFEICSHELSSPAWKKHHCIGVNSEVLQIDFVL